MIESVDIRLSITNGGTYPDGGSRHEPGGEAVGQPLRGMFRSLALWNGIWLIPALGAFVFVTLFDLLFQAKEELKSPKNLHAT